MRTLFWFSLLGLLLFEVCNVYFIMPLPGSQQLDTLPLAYFLYTKRWWFRIILLAGLLWGGYRAVFSRKWVPLLAIALTGIVLYMVNFQMAADKMFRQITIKQMVPAAQNKIDSNRLVLGVSVGNQSRAYPIRIIGYHHFVADTIEGQRILVTYCTVCRTGRVFEPIVAGKPEQFRLVGMDHFNAMLEDKSTGSWWQQATGKAVAGPLKGTQLKEVYATQTTLAEWLKLNPATLILQEDPAFANRYDTSFHYESGLSRKQLTGTDSLSWKLKSWVIGVERNGAERAYDWNDLKKNRLIEDTLGGGSILVVLAQDRKSFFAFTHPLPGQPMQLDGDTLFAANQKWLVNGKPLGEGSHLGRIPAYQEFWHSWKTFHPQSGTRQGKP